MQMPETPAPLPVENVFSATSRHTEMALGKGPTNAGPCGICMLLALTLRTCILTLLERAVASRTKHGKVNYGPILVMIQKCWAKIIFTACPAVLPSVLPDVLPLGSVPVSCCLTVCLLFIVLSCIVSCRSSCFVSCGFVL